LHTYETVRKIYISVVCIERVGFRSIRKFFWEPKFKDNERRVAKKCDLEGKGKKKKNMEGKKKKPKKIKRVSERVRECESECESARARADGVYERCGGSGLKKGI